MSAVGAVTGWKVHHETHEPHERKNGGQAGWKKKRWRVKITFARLKDRAALAEPVAEAIGQCAKKPEAFTPGFLRFGFQLTAELQAAFTSYFLKPSGFCECHFQAEATMGSMVVN